MPKQSLTPPTLFAFVGYWKKVTLTLWAITLLSFYFADTEVIALDPWSELLLIGKGFIAPDFFATEYLFDALWQTVSFALLGVCLALVWGAPVSLIYHKPYIAALCAFIRSIHEIFWALLFLQIFGLSPLTGILAIALPYGATFARVFSDILQQAPTTSLQTFPNQTDRISRYLYGRIAHVFVPIRAYVRYRFECALRSSAVLGFVGMPTLGFYLESAFRQGHYHQGAALLMMFIVLIGTIPYWGRIKLLPVYFVIAIWALPTIPDVDGALIWRFLSQDILPPMFQTTLQSQALQASAMSSGDAFSQFLDWISRLLTEQALPGVIATLILALAALGMSHLFALIGIAVSDKRLSGRFVANINSLALLILRSVPEYIFAFVFMLLLGPSMLPAMLALAIHNGALIAYLTIRHADDVSVSAHFNGRLDGYGYEVLPAIYPNMMALLFYRFEVILRETAILGMLGIATLGFYIDSNFEEIRFNGALVLMCVTALVNIVVDILSRRVLYNKNKTQLGCAHQQ
ncbi:binding-protein-dependent transport systems inner membrane component [Shewanella halifaxensis HAW-EB4]|uniref:Binding-protein-dependent transport systems inner membrane component n=1 Tax=Shewanella halifaxensis (strain HAW-EB4) TaxID=458817 RepID=B0TK66_SHEHH|nr:ABC transporter permease [Shewanella halifaxensis]ABZ77085.1 binding-protein-dependent transport systems inner membrane component [Shewanella halifaxensis HAW-EB4]